MAAFQEYPARNRHGFIHWVTHVKLFHLVFMSVLILIAVPLVAHYYISNMSVDGTGPDSFRSRTKLDHPEDLTSLKPSDLKFRVEELKRIKASVNNELRELESKRQKLHSELATFNTRIDSLKHKMDSKQMELDQIKVTIQSQRLEQTELSKRQTPLVHAPKQVLPPMEQEVYLAPPRTSLNCRMHNCFDYSRCSLTSHFPVYLYNPEDYQLTTIPVDSFVKLSVTHAFDSSPHMTLDPNIACVYVVLIGDIEGGLQNSAELESRLQQLQFWHGDGRNHILLSLARSYQTRDVFEGVNTGRAMIAQSAFTDSQLRSKFDVLIPPSLGISHGQVWDQLPPISPARRKYLMSFQGEHQLLHVLKSGQGQGNTQLKAADSASNNAAAPPGEREVQDYPGRGEADQLAALENVIIDTLKKMQSQEISGDNFKFEFICEKERLAGVNGEWTLCGPDTTRHEILQQSTFALIIAPLNYTVVSTTHIQVRIYEALKYGAVPVILGDYVRFPFDGLLTWKKAAIFLPKARITELHFLIRTYIDLDILELRKQGRLLWEKYFGSTKSIVDMLLADMRMRLAIPAFPVKDQPAPSVFNETFRPLTGHYTDPQTELEEILGPVEPPYASPRFRRNFTLYLEDFNSATDPFHIYPYIPLEPIIPGEAKYLGSGKGYRPIGEGAGGSGKEFNEGLGGNHPREQFTIVMLTYERDAVLVNALSRFKSLPHLNKVIVVWNSLRPPPHDLRWPDIGVEIHVVRTSRNSLNNRFLPYDAIETEAVLSIDDDAHLRHDEILFGFRVWRESRERIVGFPGRFHAWDLKNEGWLYNSNYSCELSMVLTGAAFFHKYYAYLYSNMMPQAIRDKVDEYLNCEDIAMNFLVAHITRKPPIKVTSRWTFRCPGCPKALSVEEQHFNERHRCINFFTKVYGYMPLLYTQFRVDSVLFKTRIPHDKQKCFKYV